MVYISGNERAHLELRGRSPLIDHRQQDPERPPRHQHYRNSRRNNQEQRPTDFHHDPNYSHHHHHSDGCYCQGNGHQSAGDSHQQQYREENNYDYRQYDRRYANDDTWMMPFDDPNREQMIRESHGRRRISDHDLNEQESVQASNTGLSSNATLLRSPRRYPFQNDERSHNPNPNTNLNAERYVHVPTPAPFRSQSSLAIDRAPTLGEPRNHLTPLLTNSSTRGAAIQQQQQKQPQPPYKVNGPAASACPGSSNPTKSHANTSAPKPHPNTSAPACHNHDHGPNHDNGHHHDHEHHHRDHGHNNTSAPTCAPASSNASNQAGTSASTEPSIVIPGVTGPNHVIFIANHGYERRFPVNAHSLSARVSALPASSTGNEPFDVSIQLPSTAKAGVGWTQKDSSGEWLSAGSVLPGSSTTFKVVPGDTLKFESLSK